MTPEDQNAPQTSAPADNPVASESERRRAILIKALRTGAGVPVVLTLSRGTAWASSHALTTGLSQIVPKRF